MNKSSRVSIQEERFILQVLPVDQETASEGTFCGWLVCVLILKKLLFVCAQHHEVALDSENTMLSTSGLVVNVFVESMCLFSEEGR